MFTLERRRGLVVDSAPALSFAVRRGAYLSLDSGRRVRDAVVMDADDLTDEDLEEFRAKLLALQDELTAALRSTDESSKTVQLDQAAVGRVSRIDAIQQQKMSSAYRQRVRIRLQQVKAALMAIDRGEYGYCAMCEEPIVLERLEIRPESPICVACQTERER